MGIEPVGEADVVGLGEEEVTGVDTANEISGGEVEDLYPGRLVVVDAQGLEGVVVVGEDDFQQVVAGARLEGLDLGRGREEGGGYALASLRFHRSAVPPCPRVWTVRE